MLPQVVADRRWMEDRLIGRALADPEFRQRLLADPRSVLESERGMALPDGMQFSIIEEAPDAFCIVLPSDLTSSPDGELARITWRRSAEV